MISFFVTHVSAGMKMKYYDVAFSALLFRRRIRNNVRQPRRGADVRRDGLVCRRRM